MPSGGRPRIPHFVIFHLEKIFFNWLSSGKRFNNRYTQESIHLASILLYLKEPLVAMIVGEKRLQGMVYRLRKRLVEINL